MPRVNKVNAAGKAYPEVGVNKGDTYYWWKFRYGPKIRSKVPPRPSQLTQSFYLSEVYAIEEWFDDIVGLDEGDRDQLVAQLGDIQSGLQERFGNLPDGIQSGPTGELLENRVAIIEEFSSELEKIEYEGPNPEERAHRLAIEAIPDWG